MNEKISLNFGNPLEKNPIPKDTFTAKSTLFANKKLDFMKNKALNKNVSFNNSFSYKSLSKTANPILNKKLNTNLNSSSIEPKLDYNKIGGEALKRINQQKNLPMWGDYDNDGVKNILDCWPLDPKRQGALHTIESIYADPRLTEEEKQSAILSLQAQEETTQQPVQVEQVQEQPQETSQQSALRKLSSYLYSATGIPDKLEERRQTQQFQRDAKLAALEAIRADIAKGKDSEFAKEIARQEVRKLFPQQPQPSQKRPVGSFLDTAAYGARSSLIGVSQGIGMVGLGRATTENVQFGSYPGEQFGGMFKRTINPNRQTQTPTQMVPQAPQGYTQPTSQVSTPRISQQMAPQGGDLKTEITNAKKPFWGPVAPDGRRWSERSKKYVTYERGNYQDYTRPTYNTQYGGGY